MTRNIRICFVVLLALFLASCGAPEPVHSAQPGSSGVVHVGDMWYLPVNLDGLPEANMEEIFSTIQRWQSEHSGLQIVDVDYHYMQNTHSSETSNYTYGVSLLTKPK